MAGVRLPSSEHGPLVPLNAAVTALAAHEEHATFAESLEIFRRIADDEHTTGQESVTSLVLPIMVRLPGSATNWRERKPLFESLIKEATDKHDKQLQHDFETTNSFLDAHEGLMLCKYKANPRPYAVVTHTAIAAGIRYDTPRINLNRIAAYSDDHEVPYGSSGQLMIDAAKLRSTVMRDIVFDTLDI